MSFIYCHLNLHANLLIPWRFPLIHDTFTQSITETKNTYVCVCVCVLSLYDILTPYAWYFYPLPIIYWTLYQWIIEPPVHGILNPLPLVFDPVTHGILTPYTCYIEPSTHGILTSQSMVYWIPKSWYIEPLSMVYRTTYSWYNICFCYI